MERAVRSLPAPRLFHEGGKGVALAFLGDLQDLELIFRQ
jgi:hypothetical protein